MAGNPRNHSDTGQAGAKHRRRMTAKPAATRAALRAHELRRTDRILELAREFAEAANGFAEVIPLLNDCLSRIRAITSCHAIGLCILSETGQISYQASDNPGLAAQKQSHCPVRLFKEGSPAIRCDRKACLEPDFTDCGSFYTNHASAMLSDRKSWEVTKTPLLLGHPGCESMALVPIRGGGRNLGFIHLEDEQPDLISPELIQFLELAGVLIGSSIERISARELSNREPSRRQQRLDDQAGELASAHIELQAEQDDTISDLFDRMPQGVQIIGREFDMLNANPAVIGKLGEIDGRKCYQYHYDRTDPYPACQVLPGRAPRKGQRSGLADGSPNLVGVPILNDGAQAKFATIQGLLRRRRYEDELRFLSMRLLQAHEEERGRFSRELHDGLSQALSVLKLRISIIRKQLRPDQASIREECEETVSYLNQVIEETRQLSRDLSPPALEDLGLATALRRLANQFAKSDACRVSSHIGEIDRALSKDAGVHLFRVFQEALTNVAKHASAENVLIRAETKDGRLVCSIEDDGRGFEIHHLPANPEKRGLGLAIMRERVRMLGSTIAVKSSSGKGTSISFSLPITRAMEES